MSGRRRLTLNSIAVAKPYRLFVGDCREVLRTLPENSVHCCVTSPPYFGLRSYQVPPTVWGGAVDCNHEWGNTRVIKDTRGVVGSTLQGTFEPAAQRLNGAHGGAFCANCNAWRGHLGLEPTPDLYVAHLVEVFREVKRVLRDDATLWLNLGDSFAGGGNGGGGVGRGGLDPAVDKNQQATWKANGRTPAGLKPKDLIGIPWMVAFALRADGWFLRSDNVWAKLNAMPESIKGVRWERCRVKVASAPPATNGYNAEAHAVARRAREYSADVGGQQYVGATYTPCPGCGKCAPHGGYVLRKGAWRPTRAHEYVFQLTVSGDYYSDGDAVSEDAVTGARGSKFTRGKTAVNGGERLGQGPRDYDAPTRNKRSVWNIASQPFAAAHFATFPPALIEPCIRASTSEYGTCAACGAPYARVIERTNMIVRPSERRESAHANGAGSGRTMITGTMLEPATTTTTGWRATCACNVGAVPATVIDPFNGAGTSLVVALANNRRYIGIDLNPDYIQMTVNRTYGAEP